MLLHYGGIMSFEYKMEHGSYYLYNTDKPVNSITKKYDIVTMCDEIAIAFDKESFTLLKHGSPENVNKWYQTARAKYIEAGFEDMAQALVVIQGAFPVEEVNKCLSHSGYIQKFWEKLNTNQITSAKMKV